MSGITLTKLTDLMDAKKLRPESLAAKTGLSLSTIMKARRGGNVTLGTATLIAQGMKAKICELQ